MTDGVGPATERALFAVVAIAVLVVTAPFLPSATVDGTAPAAVEGGAAGDQPEQTAEDVSTDESGSEFVANQTESQPEDAALDVAVDASNTGGYVVPGRDVTVTVRSEGSAVEDATVSVDGVVEGQTDEHGQATVDVPGTDEMTVEARSPGGATGERTVNVEDDVSLTVASIDRDGRAEVRAEVAGYALSQARILVGGEQVGLTDDDGVTNVPVPDDAEQLSLAVEYDELRTDRTIDLDLDVEVESLAPVAGSTVDVAATYGDVPAEVDVYVVAGDATDDPGSVVEDRDPSASDVTGGASDWLPPASSATVVVTDGHETAAVGVEGLFRNLALGVVLALSLLVGVFLSSLRVLRWLDVVEERETGSTPAADLLLPFATLGSALVATAAGLATVVSSVSVPRIPTPSIPRVSLPRVSLPRLRLPSLPNLSRPGLPSVSLPSVSLPSLSLPSAEGIGLPSFAGSSSEEADESPSTTETTDPFAPEAEEDEVPQLSKRELVRAAIRDLGRLADVRRVETSTPGQIGRRALDRALPREPVEAIVGTVREVEYAGAEPTDEDASRVREAVRRLRDALAEDEGGDRS